MNRLRQRRDSTREALARKLAWEMIRTKIPVPADLKDKINWLRKERITRVAPRAMTQRLGKQIDQAYRKRQEIESRYLEKSLRVRGSKGESEKTSFRRELLSPELVRPMEKELEQNRAELDAIGNEHARSRERYKKFIGK